MQRRFHVLCRLGNLLSIVEFINNENLIITTIILIILYQLQLFKTVEILQEGFDHNNASNGDVARGRESLHQDETSSGDKGISFLYTSDHSSILN